LISKELEFAIETDLLFVDDHVEFVIVLKQDLKDCSELFI
jgi:hypothetical protein